MRFRFTKMHGCGNDFVMIDGVTQAVSLTPDNIRLIADRHFGVGCDQLLIVETPLDPDFDFRYRIYNQDGTEVENCGNGARCFAKFVLDRRLTPKKTIRVQTCNGDMTLQVQDNGMISVDMGVPRLTPAQIPFKPANGSSEQAATYSIQVGGQLQEVSTVSMGNPHAVLVVDSTENAPVQALGSAIQQLPEFPEGVNVGFMAVLSRQEINLRVLERGVGETLACGTGACAAVVAGQLRGLLDNRVTVNLTGGTVVIEWDGQSSVIQTGPAVTVFQGQIKI